MKHNIDIVIDTALNTEKEQYVNLKIMSKDVNNNQFFLRFKDPYGDDLKLDSTYTVEILSSFRGAKTEVRSDATIMGEIATWTFDTSLITREERVYNYVYLKKAGGEVITADANAFWFHVDLSEIDKPNSRIATSYDSNYQAMLDAFGLRVADLLAVADAEALRAQVFAQLIASGALSSNIQDALAQLEADYAPQLTLLNNKVTSVVKEYSVMEFGAVGDGVFNDTTAVKAALAFMNARYPVTDTMFTYDQKRGKLIFPPDHSFVINDTLVATGNYGIEILSPLLYTGANNKTMFKIGADAYNTGGSDYILGARVHTSSIGVIAFEMKNIVYANIRLTKLHGFHEGFRAIATNVKGWYGNTIHIGTMYANVIDIHITNDTLGWPNANVWIGGFFNKEFRSGVDVQNFVKFSSLDGSYEMIDSNLFIGQSFEHGKGYTMPIDLRAATNNKFVDLRIENVTDDVLAIVSKRLNKIKLRGHWTTGTDVISDSWQHTFMGEESEMYPIYDTGDLATTLVVSAAGDQFYHPTLSFINVWGSGTRSALSPAGAMELTDKGLKIAQPYGLMAIRLKNNGDRYFHIKVQKDPDKRMNFGAKCFDAAGVPLLQESAARIADPNWNIGSYIKTTDISSFYYSGDMPNVGSGAYSSGSDTYDEWIIETHPDTEFVEFYVKQGNTSGTREATISRITVASANGNAIVIDPSTDRLDFVPIGSKLVNSTDLDLLLESVIPTDSEVPTYPVAYSSGDLGTTAIRTNNMTIWHPTLSFKSAWNATPPSALSQDDSNVTHSPQGIKLLTTSMQLMVKIELNGDNRIIVNVLKDEGKLFNLGVRPLNAAGNPMTYENPAINVAPWNSTHYIEGQGWTDFYVSTEVPNTGMSGYLTGSDTLATHEFLVHPDVKFLEIYVKQGNTAGTRDVTVKQIIVHGNKNGSTVIDPAVDRSLYKLVNGKVYEQHVINNELQMVLIGEEPSTEPFMHTLYNSGNLGLTAIQTPSLRTWHPTLAYRSAWSSAGATSASPASSYDKTANGIRLAAADTLMLVKLELNGDNRIRVSIEKDAGKFVNVFIRPLNINGAQMTLNNPSIIGPFWSTSHYVEGIGTTDFYVSTDFPYTDTSGSYMTGSDSSSEVEFFVHPDVRYIEVYVRQGNTTGTRDARVKQLLIRGNKGSSTFADPTTDRSNYKLVGDTVYTQTVTGSALTLEPL